MKYLLLFTILVLAHATTVFAERKCFQTDALKGLQIVYLEIGSGGKASGTFEYENGESELARKYKFTGTLAGKDLRVKFANGELPDVAPSEMKNLNWKIAKRGGSEILLIPFYGKNYETEKYVDYVAEFQPCAPNYDELTKTAKRLAFTRGASSARLSLTFFFPTERRAFWLKARKNQTIAVKSVGCAISFYYPDKKFYEEAAGVDVLTLETIPQSGDYLFVIKPAGANGECPTEFKITN